MVGIGADFIDEEVARKYEMVKKIGRGLYGIVWQAKILRYHEMETVAVKRMFNAFSNKIDAKRSYRELSYLLYFTNHPNIVSVQDIMAGSNDMDMYLITECTDTDLASIIQSM